MRQINKLPFYILAFVVGLLSCTKPVLIGSDFLEDEKSSIHSRDDFPLSFYTQKTDSIIVHSNDVSKQLTTFLLGRLNDPIFGRSSAEIYAQPILPTVGTVLLGSTLDSVVLQLKYDTLGSYGNKNEEVTIEVYQMAENPPFFTEYYSNDRFLDKGDLLGSLTFIPKPKDSVVINLPDDTLVLPPHVRIPLERIKMRDILLQDSITLENQDSFLHYFNGLCIRITGASNTMLGFNLLNAVSGLSYYYDKDPLLDQEFRMIFTSGSVKVVHMEHDYTGSVVEHALSFEPELDYWYLQGMSGLTTYMRIGGLDSVKNTVINQAEFEFYATFPEGDRGDMYPPCPYLITQERTDTALNYSTDVTDALILTQGAYTSESFNIIFGGHLGDPDPGPPVVFKYTMKVTSQIKEILEEGQENIIYFNPFDKGDFPNRAVLFGPNHPVYAPRLRIYYTSL